MAANSDSARSARGGKTGGPPSTADGVASPESAVNPKPAEKERKYLGKYKIERTLGAGGMGAVYLATDMELRRQVALKILPKDKAENPRLVQRFKAEAQAAAKLKHENIVAIHDAGEIDGQLFIALEYIDGNDVHQLVAKRGVIPVKRSIEIITQVAKALEHAWEHKLVHRDIKPSNLMVRRDGVVKLADLGLARTIDESIETGITRAGTTVGTVDYMAPEQARDSKAADVRSDIYSLGCTWYHMLTGSPPYPDGALTNKLHAHAVKAPPDPRSQNDHVPDGVVAVLHRMMAKKPEDRYQNPTELLEDLARATLNRENVSNSLLAALAEADSSTSIPTRSGSTTKIKAAAPTAEDEVVSESPRAKSPRKTIREETVTEPREQKPARRNGDGSGPQVALPPKDAPNRKRGGDDDGEESKGANFEPLKDVGKYAAIVALLAVTIGTIWYITNRFASGLDSPSQRKRNPFDHQLAENTAEAGKTEGEPKEGESKPGDPKDPEKKDPTQNLPKSNDTSDPNKKPAESTSPGNTGKPTGSSGQPNTGANPPEGTKPTQPTPKPGGSDTPKPAAPPKILIGRESERPQIPQWVAYLPAREDIAGIEKAKTLPVLTVGRAGDAPSQFSTLGEAIEAVPKTGGIIRLVGDGPFFLRPVEVSGKGRLVIAAGESNQPVVMLLPAADGTAHRILRATNMSLELLGVHLTAVARQFPSPDELTLVEVAAGDLSVRQCSVTLRGQRPGATRAFKVGSGPTAADRQPPDSARVLLDRVFVRGARLTPLHATSAALDLVASNSLFAPGEGPTLVLKEPPPGPPKSDPKSDPKGDAKTGKPDEKAADEKPLRTLRFFSCTHCGSKVAFDLQPADKKNPQPTTSVTVLNSVVAVDRPGGTGTFLEMGGWPVAESHSSDKPMYQNLQFDIPTTLVAGFERLLTGQADFVQGNVGPAVWQQIWRKSVPGAQFVSQPWPGRPLDDPARLAPGELDASSLASSVVKPEGGGFCGCQVDQLRVPSDALLVRCDAMANRPIRVPAVPQGSSAEIRTSTFDANKEDIGKAITNGNWPSGATLRITGVGNVKSQPISLKGKSARLEIDPGLTIETREMDYRGGSGAEAFISTAGGSVEIIGGRFRIPASTRGDIPKWFLSVENGSFALEGCMVHGPMLSGARFESLIRWVRTGNDAVKPQPAGHYERYGRIQNCYLASFGKVVLGDIRGRGLSVQNSALVSLDEIFDLNLAGPDGRISAAVDLQDTTLSAVSTFFHVRGAPLSQKAEAPLQLFSDRCAFVSAVDTGNGQPSRVVFLNYTANARVQGQIDWWAFGNAYSDDIRPWIRGDADSAPDQDFDKHWIGIWGAAHEFRPLWGRGAVLTRGGFRLKTKLSHTDFEVDPSSKAAKWGVSGGPIGPSLAFFNEQETKPAEKPGKKTETKPPVVRPNF